MQIERLPAEMREYLRAILPEKAFIRRDRGYGLFISNAPVFSPDLDGIPGFLAEREGALLRLLPDESWAARLEGAFPNAPDFFCETLRRFCGSLPDRANLALFARGLKILDAVCASTDEISAYDRELRQRAAVALRGGCGGALYAAALLNYKIHTLI